MCSEGAGTHPAHVVPHAEVGHHSSRTEKNFGEDAPNWD